MREWVVLLGRGLVLVEGIDGRDFWREVLIRFYFFNFFNQNFNCIIG